YCIDNMPPVLLNTFLELLENKGERNKIAVVIDIRSTENFESLIEVLNEKEKFNYDIKVVYLDIKTHIVLKRYKLTRRKHPYADRFNGDIAQALAYEREILSSVRLRADHIIDTSDISGNQLRDRLTQILLGSDRDVMNIHVMSFGFKHGIPTEADFVIDVRCLPNPYWVENLRTKTGLDEEVINYVFSFNESKKLLDKLIDMLDFLNPLYIKEGKSQIVFAIGCTGGNHRSVAIAEALKEHFCGRWDNVSVNHRDINRN
ncbi:MAG: RNase adapter RapZ, partial [Eubacterium sp.]|nr:RNase adapter RapZ [Eubacterium sp.]